MSAFNASSLFTGGVGRRILSLFLLAGLVPVIFTAYLSYSEVNRGLKQDAFAKLREHARAYGDEVLARLDRADRKAQEIAAVVRDLGAAELQQRAYLTGDFAAIWSLAPDGLPATVLYGEVPASAVLPADSARLAQGGAQLLPVFAAAGPQFVLLRAAAGRATGAGVLAFLLEPDTIWGKLANLPYQTSYCAFTVAGRQLHCMRDSGAGMPESAGAPANLERDRVLEWRAGENLHYAAMWRLSLAGLNGDGDINIVASQPRSYALRSSTDLQRIFLPALGLVALLVAALSFNLISESLLPLRRLIVAARRFAGGKLSTRVRLRTGDEFETLADSFNQMAVRLQRQIGMLKAMSNIDRLILSGADFEAVSEDVIRYLLELAECDAAAVIARDPDSPAWAKMISWGDNEFTHERIALPQELGFDWCQPRQVNLHAVDATVAPYKSRFEAYDRQYVVMIPVVQGNDLKGILLLASQSKFDLQQGGLTRATDLAGRLAVALTSVEREEVLYRQAHYDELTGLPNRQLLKDRLEQQLVQVRRDGQGGAMLFLDLDRFKEINDVFGHSIGDIVLAQAAERIVGEVRESDTVARLGGDEFVIVLPRLTGNSTVRATAGRLLKRLSEVFCVRGVNHFLSASIGIVLFPDDGDSVETLLKNADSAMYRAKDAGRSTFEFFSEELNAESRRKIDLERELRAALQEDRLDVFYQPQFNLVSGEICGAEALTRWHHHSYGPVPPTEFIPLAEDSGLIVDLGRWVVERSAADLQSILKMGLHPGPVSINVSARQLRDTSFPRDVLQSMRKYGIDPGFLQLEVTETTVAQNRDTAIDILNLFREAGVKIAIDDFGTGYSSLSYLQQLPFDVIKIDKSFIDLIEAGDKSQNICRTIIRMAHELGKEVIAEGVETREQADFLADNACDAVQGYYYSKPLPQERFFEFVAQQDFHTQRRKALEIA
ncbi:MAG: hypothetical protein BMS9Abin32_101 [Gammaproteobacteria bacterium]|nr:MAG: hypothetical protein BMS9Abin32_101 [Gammaproteobacteria bacterium]